MRSLTVLIYIPSFVGALVSSVRNASLGVEQILVP